MKKVLIVIPCYNEHDKLIRFLPTLKKFKKKYTFLFINDASTDDSKKIIINNKFACLTNKHRKGIGYNLKKGLFFSLENKFKITVFMSSNGKMDINDVSKIIKPIEEKKFEYINGSRFLRKNQSFNLPKFRHFSIKLISFLLSIFYNKQITDFSCGFRAMLTNKFIKFIKVNNNKIFNSYGFEYYLYAKVLLSKIKYKELSVKMIYPSNTSEKYTKITPFYDWIIMLLPWIIAKFDNKKML
jgi:hypothetical protein